jgi:hypothetical protein
MLKEAPTITARQRNPGSSWPWHLASLAPRAGRSGPRSSDQRARDLLRHAQVGGVDQQADRYPAEGVKSSRCVVSHCQRQIDLLNAIRIKILICP